MSMSIREYGADLKAAPLKNRLIEVGRWLVFLLVLVHIFAMAVGIVSILPFAVGELTAWIESVYEREETAGLTAFVGVYGVIIIGLIALLAGSVKLMTFFTDGVPDAWLPAILRPTPAPEPDCSEVEGQLEVICDMLQKPFNEMSPGELEEMQDRLRTWFEE